MLHIDIKYLNLFSSNLERYKVKSQSPFTANFRCPECGDSKKSKWKARGYVYEASNQRLLYKCHNCQTGMSVAELIKRHQPELHAEMIKERFGRNTTANTHIDNQSFEQPQFDYKKDVLSGLMDRCDSLDQSHPAIRYLNDRQVPVNKFSNLYYLDDSRKVDQLDQRYKDRLNSSDPRIVIPAFNKINKLVGLTMRAIDPNAKLRYIAIKLRDDQPMIFNLNTVDFTKTVYCVEGPFDSLFLPNAVAVGGSSLLKAMPLLPQTTTFVFDNQPRNKEIISLMRTAVDKGASICLWPDVGAKDINEMIVNGMTTEQIVSIIDNNTYKGLTAKINLSQWRKCK